MKTLIFTAHPSTEGTAHAIAHIYEEEQKSLGNEVEIINLYEHPQEYVQYQNIEDMGQDDFRDMIQQKILTADMLVFAFPLWWYEPPAIVKNFIDRNFTTGFAFKFENGMPKGLLKGKYAQIFVTTGGPGWMYRFGFLPFCRSFLETLKFCGIKIQSKHIFGGHHGKMTAVEKQNELETVRIIAKKTISL